LTAAATHIKGRGFEPLYSELRQKEGRVYTDEEVLLLPAIAREHPHYREWQIRKESCKRLKQYAERISSPDILEVGCGHGWLARHLAEIPGSHLTGIDVNYTELQQAARVFNPVTNLHFIHGGIDVNELEDAQFDLILFAASIQYFSSLKDILSMAMGKLKTNGEIHILDSVFYQPEEVGAAKERTAGYYRDLGFPEMTQYYFHHSTNELNFFHYKTLYQPSLINRLSNNRNPFPWICIKKPVI